MPERNPGVASPFATLTIAQKAALYERASELFSDNKRALFDRLAPLRTRHISVVLEDIYQSHNASAVLRSCDCFGVQDVHVVEAHNPFNPAGDVAVAAPSGSTTTNTAPSRMPTGTCVSTATASWPPCRTRTTR